MAQEEKLQDLKIRLAAFMSRLDEMEPEETSVQDIDQLIQMLEELEKKM
ncbi:hypothetical protein GCM10007216_35220 [Thalassobacillus devorans]|uniref:Uncharacterized protein n=1 Tax=Thalassobacillus devorans TaxID=279813 RepID=A0ABQ1PQU8_9BACI|nr:SE1561 family protein [Thalassobacillus devorans]NIK30623.1 hypothetical protein [Thalassobacillus devorans]GGD01460.1 hypothetical protein GCM10007216_35220 [Thalassobacillus devorans]